MNKTNDKYIFKYWYEYGGPCLWAGNDKTNAEYGTGLTGEELSISEELISKLHKLEDEYQNSLNWDCPSDPSPWSRDEWDDFKERALEVYERLCKELGSDYEIINELDSSLRS